MRERCWLRGRLLLRLRGSALSGGCARAQVCAAGPGLVRLEVSDAHAVTPDASLVARVPELSALRSLRELVCNNQRRSPHVAHLDHLTYLQARWPACLGAAAACRPGVGAGMHALRRAGVGGGESGCACMRR
jgi:hypothetical protein